MSLFFVLTYLDFGINIIFLFYHMMIHCRIRLNNNIHVVMNILVVEQHIPVSLNHNIKHSALIDLNLNLLKLHFTSIL